jgi:error-prone DNA polymerase
MTDLAVPYAELHAHSAFSFLDGASHPEELAAEGARLGLTSLAITDHDGLYGVVRFSEAAKKVGLKTSFGAELHLPAPAGANGAPVLDPPTGTPDPRATHLLVLARGEHGYRNLSSAIGTAHLDAGVKGAANYTLESLGEASKGEWLILTGCRKGAVRQALTAPLSAGYLSSRNGSRGQISSTQRTTPPGDPAPGRSACAGAPRCPHRFPGPWRRGRSGRSGRPP